MTEVQILVYWYCQPTIPAESTFQKEVETRFFTT